MLGRKPVPSSFTWLADGAGAPLMTKSFWGPPVGALLCSLSRPSRILSVQQTSEQSVPPQAHFAGEE